MSLLLKESPESRTTASVMVVDDQLTSCNVLSAALKNIDPNLSVTSFQNATTALAAAEIAPPDLVITDYKMPNMNGIEFTKHLRRMPHCNDIPIMMITIMKEKSILYEALESGVTDFLNKPFDKTEYKSKCKNLLSLGKRQTELKKQQHFLTQQINASTDEILVREKETLDRLTRACAYKDCITGEHLLRIGRISYILALELGMDEYDAKILEIASPLHDIGKLAIPDKILMKKGKLTSNEFETMKTHTTIGYEILKDSPSPYLQTGALIALNHHEKFDGSGYPNGLSGKDIPIEARIVTVADVFDSLTHERPYKKAWPLDETLIYIKAISNKHLDQKCVNALIRKIDDIDKKPS